MYVILSPHHMSVNTHTQLAFMEQLVSAKHCFQSLAWINSYNPHKYPLRQRTIIISILQIRKTR